MLRSHDSHRVFVKDEASQKLILPVYKHGWSTEKQYTLKDEGLCSDLCTCGTDEQFQDWVPTGQPVWPWRHFMLCSGDVPTGEEATHWVVLAWWDQLWHILLSSRKLALLSWLHRWWRYPLASLRRCLLSRHMLAEGKLMCQLLLRLLSAVDCYLVARIMFLMQMANLWKDPVSFILLQCMSFMFFL